MKIKKTIIFRVDGSNKLGMGHIVRSINIANTLKTKGYTPYFVTRNYPESIAFIKKHHFPLQILKAYQKLQSSPLIKIIKEQKSHILIHDILNTSAAYILKLKTNLPTLKIVNFDDLGQGKNLADILIDANIASTDQTENKLFGPQYIYLKEEFAKAALKKKNTPEIVKKILITFGGSDPRELTLKTIKILQNNNYSRYHFSVILGPGFKNKNKLKDLCQKSKNFKSFENITTKNLINLMQQSDLCLGSGGITMYETSCLGLPSIILCQVPHEIKNAEKFVQAGIVINLSLGKKVTSSKLLHTINMLIENQPLRKKMSQKGKETIDGKGAARICRKIDKLIKM